MGLGTFGQVASQSLYEQKKKQYPNQYTAKDFKNQYGKRVHDCVGLIKGYLLSNEEGKLSFDEATFRKYDKDVSGMKANCLVAGDIKTIPEKKGLLVFMYGHVGVYIGNGEVIEARGHKYGVVKTKLNERPWTSWGMLDWIDYEEKKEMNEQYGYEVYNTIDEVPAWAKESIQKAVNTGILKGDGEKLLLTLTEIKVLCWLDRCGCFDNIK